jgi:general secretion pathway protein D
MLRKTYFAAAIFVGALALAAFAADDALPPPITCGSPVPGGINCAVSKQDRKDARAAYARGLKLEADHHPRQAYEAFDEAARLVPQDPQFLIARETVKGQLVYQLVSHGNELLATNARPQAAAEFRAALDLDPENQFAAQRLEDSVRPAIEPAPVPIHALADAVEIHLQPKGNPGKRSSFQFRGDVRALFNQIAETYGLTVQFDDSVQNRQVRFFVDDVDFFTALNLACQVSKSMWAALEDHQFLVAADNAENHKQFDRMSLQAFVLPDHTATQEVNEYLLALRNMFDLKFITSDLNANTVSIRAPQPVLAACGALLNQMRHPRPQVMLNIRVLEISHALTRVIGLHVPNTFNLYNIPAAALIGLGGQNIQQLINQLISSGGINQAGSTSLAGLLAQLTGGQNSIFSQPLATFGGGLTFFGLSLDQIAAQLSVNESWSRTLSDVMLRAANNDDATLHVGERYPIMNASYAPIYNSPQISQVLGNQSYVPPIPSVSYEDLGLKLKARPVIHGDGSIGVSIELEVRSLTGAASNGVPVISNKEFKGYITVPDGEPAFVAGQVSVSDTVSLSGIPGLGIIPGLSSIASENTKEEDDDELLIAITPHVVGNFERSTPPIWVTAR